MYAFFFFSFLYCGIFVWYVVKGVWAEMEEDFVAVPTERKSDLQHIS